MGASRLQRLEHWVAVQNRWNLLDGLDSPELEQAAEALGLGIIPYTPLASGILTGKYRRGEEPPTGSRMTMRPEPYRHLENEHVYDGLDALAAAAEAHGVSTGGLALAWALGSAGSVVVGPRRPEHLEAVREALSLALSQAEHDSLGSLFQP